MSSWEHFPHGSDIGIRGIGDSLAESFSMAGLALCALFCELDKVQNTKQFDFEISGTDVNFLFYDWINQLIYEISTQKVIFSEFQVVIHRNPLHLYAQAFGDKINPELHAVGVEVKGATLTELKVEQIQNSWISQCVVDV